MQNNSATWNEVYQFCFVYLFRPRPQPGPHLHSMCTAREIFAVAQTETIRQSSERTPEQFMASASVSSRRNPLKVFFPFYIDFIRDPRYIDLEDYQQAWFLNLVVEAWVSERPGYLLDNGQLWRLAKARTPQFFEKERGPVTDGLFEREGPTTDGEIWIYNRALLEIYEEQVLKIHKKRRKSSKSTDDNTTSYLDFEGTLKKENGREECSVHPQSGLTQWGTCWECYADKCSSQVS